MNDKLIEVLRINEVSAILTPNSQSKKDVILAKTAKITVVNSNEELTTAVERVREAKRFLAVIEADRVSVKAPILNLGKRVDEIAANFCSDLEAEIVRLEGDRKTRTKGLITVWQEREQERLDKEAKRIADEAAAATRAAEAAIAEQERVANLQRPSATKIVQTEIAAQTALSNLAEVKAQVPVPVVKVAGLKSGKVLDYKITDARALYAARPEWFNEPTEKKSIIKASLVKGMQLPGLEVFETFDSGVRR